MKVPSMTLYKQAVSRPSKLIYGSSNEHPNSEKLILETLPPNARVLTICGGADNFLTLLAHDKVASIICVDMNPYQLALGELKLVMACSDLSTLDILCFMGMDRQSLRDCDKRLDMYHKVLRPELSAATVRLVQENLMYEIEMGIGQVGSEINSMRYIQNELDALGFSADDLWQGGDRVNLTKLQRVCRQGIGTPEGFAKAAFSEKFYPETYQQKWVPICHLYYNKVFQAVSDPEYAKTFNKSIMIRGYYDTTCLPEWLEPSNRQRIRERRNCVHFVESPIDQVQSEKKHFDLISTSNIFDWIELQQGAKILETLAEKLSDQGCMLVRMGFSPVQILVELVSNVAYSDKVSPGQVADLDYSHFWYKNRQGIAILQRKCDQQQ